MPPVKQTGFTEIENRVGYAVAEGKTIAQIAAERDKSINTVRRQIERIAGKIGNPTKMSSRTLVMVTFAKFSAWDTAMQLLARRAETKRTEENHYAANECENCHLVIERLRFGRKEE